MQPREVSTDDDVVSQKVEITSELVARQNFLSESWHSIENVSLSLRVFVARYLQVHANASMRANKHGGLPEFHAKVPPVRKLGPLWPLFTVQCEFITSSCKPTRMVRRAAGILLESLRTGRAGIGVVQPREVRSKLGHELTLYWHVNGGFQWN